MFGQESYDKATVQVESQPGGLFHNYEIKPWGFSPSIYKIVLASAILNLAFLAVVSQTNVLTARGCDSPWVGRVCQVVDMTYVAAMLYGTPREYVDEAYENIDLGEADITYIDVTNVSPPLSYPEGYFQIANPVQYAMLQQMAQNPGAVDSFQSSTTPYTPLGGGEPDLLKIQPNPPASDGNEFKDDSSGLFKVEGTPSTAGNVGPRKGRGGKIRPGTNTGSKNPDAENTVAENSNTNTQPTPQVTTPTDPVAGPDLNKRPVIDLANWVNEKVASKEVDLQTEFQVNAKGRLDKNGRLDPKTFQWVQAASPDEDMVEVVKRAIEAINMAGYLQYLKDMSGKDFNFQLQQDADNISAVILSEMETDTRARSIKSGLDLIIGLAKQKKQDPNADQNDKDDLVLLENAKVETDGKRVVLRFVVPKTIAHPMIQRKLAEQAAANLKPSGLTPTQTGNNTAVK